MLDIGWTEMLVVVLVLILVVGPKDLPKVVRTVGQWTAKARRMSREFTSSLEEIGREAELDDLRRDLKGIGTGTGGSVTSIEKHIDPDGSLKKSIQDDYATGKAGQFAAPSEGNKDEGEESRSSDEKERPAQIPADGDAVAAAANQADATTDTPPPAKAGA